jgi:hypothetical protein
MTGLPWGLVQVRGSEGSILATDVTTQEAVGAVALRTSAGEREVRALAVALAVRGSGRTVAVPRDRPARPPEAENGKEDARA